VNLPAQGGLRRMQPLLRFCAATVRLPSSATAT
jgi:hypothetical protein